MFATFIWVDSLSLPSCVFAAGLESGRATTLQEEKHLRHMNTRGPQLFYSFVIRWMKAVRIGAQLFTSPFIHVLDFFVKSSLQCATEITNLIEYNTVSQWTGEFSAHKHCTHIIVMSATWSVIKHSACSVVFSLTTTSTLKTNQISTYVSAFLRSARRGGGGGLMRVRKENLKSEGESMMDE